MASRSCVSGCGRFLASSDGHDRCPSCLGFQHAEASGDELGSGDDDSAELPPSGRVALPESDPELTAMLSLAAESVGLHWRPPPSPERSRSPQADRRQPPPVPFFPEVHEASALHAMALLQVHQAKALKQLHEGGADPGVLQELRTATDLALRATKVTARALGQTMSMLVVQERHLWLTLADMRESDKHRFLDSPISQAGLFGEAVEDFAQQFSAAKKQTEAFCHILPRRSAAVSSTLPPAAAPPSARRRGRPPAASTSAPARPWQQPSLQPQRGAGRRKAPQPAAAPAKPVKRQGRRRP